VLAEIGQKKEISGSARRTWELAEAFHSYLADCTNAPFPKKTFIVAIYLILTVERCIFPVKSV